MMIICNRKIEASVELVENKNRKITSLELQVACTTMYELSLIQSAFN